MVRIVRNDNNRQAAATIDGYKLPRTYSAYVGLRGQAHISDVVQEIERA
jgi:hypothetical protein